MNNLPLYSLRLQKCLLFFKFFSCINDAKSFILSLGRTNSKKRRKTVKVPAYWGSEIKHGRVYFPENFNGVDSLNVADKKPLSPIKEVRDFVVIFHLFSVIER